MRDPSSTRLEAMVRDAVRAQQAGDFAAALAIAQHAAADKLQHPVLLRIQGQALAMAGHYPEAGAMLNRALALDPRDAQTIADIGRVLMAEDRADDAMAAFRAALSVRPDLAELWLELGALHELRREDAAADAAFRKAHALLPSAAGPLAAMASVAARNNDPAGVREFAERALRVQPDHAAASLALAGLDFRERRYDEAVARVERLIAAGTLDEQQSLAAYSTLTEALDKLGRYREAFEASARWNEITRRTYAPRFGDGGRVENHLHFMQRLMDWFARQDHARWRQPWDPGDYVSPVKRHVFLFGYPRSGTTLLENILASFPGVRGLEERPTLAAPDWEFLRNDQTLDRLTDLDPDLARAQRAAYWQQVRREVPDVDGNVFVDMGPLYGIKLQLVARLFPDAILVRCRRDPRDVVLSCFKKAFRVNASTYQMTTLEGAARHFDQAMRLTELHLGVLPLPVHVVDYATLVADFDTTTRALAEFVGVPWTEDVRAFERTAAGRSLRTASADQVRRGLYDGTRQWLRYREQLEPVLPILEPWVTRFGYPL